MNPNEVACLTGVSVRTLHHYDKIGLLCPTRNKENGYREYTPLDLDLLQQILFFRECGFTLHHIQTLLHSPSYDRSKALHLQRDYLLREKQRINAMLHTLEQTIKADKGEIHMTDKEKFAGFDFSKNPYETEARKLWGDQAVDQSAAKLSGLTSGGKQTLEKHMNALFAELATLRHLPPEHNTVHNAMHRMYCFFNENFGVHYSLEAFAGLGQMYVTDKRFEQNIDKFGEGLAVFLSKAMTDYAQREQAQQP